MLLSRTSLDNKWPCQCSTGIYQGERNLKPLQHLIFLELSSNSVLSTKYRENRVLISEVKARLVPKNITRRGQAEEWHDNLKQRSCHRPYKATQIKNVRKVAKLKWEIHAKKSFLAFCCPWPNITVFMQTVSWRWP